MVLVSRKPCLLRIRCVPEMQLRVDRGPRFVGLAMTTPTRKPRGVVGRFLAGASVRMLTYEIVRPDEQLDDARTRLEVALRRALRKKGRGR